MITEDLRDQPINLMTIYLVEDSLAVCERFLLEFCSVPNVQVVGVASEAADAIAGIGRTGPDLVVLDLNLSQGSGMDVLRAVERWSPRPRIWVVSNLEDPTTRELVSRAGADCFFDKSTELDALVDAVTQYASG